jgi:hypothetical protein
MEIPSAIILTNCTNRKRSPGPIVCASDIIEEKLSNGSVEEIADNWLKKVSRSTQKFPIEQTYGGRSFTEAKWVAKQLNANLFVVSAGLGLLPPKSCIPNYNLTVGEGKASIRQILKVNDSNPSEWWNLLNEKIGCPNPIQQLIRSNRGVPIFLALPAAYLLLIKQDLAGITPTEALSLKILTSPLGVGEVPFNLAPNVLPYDERLEGIYPGTRTDFPQRAMRHFISNFSLKLSNEAARKAVMEILSNAKKPELPMRQKKTDEEIIVILQTEWNRFDGRSTRLLRFLRDEIMVACEQSRFRDLWRKIALARTLPKEK